MGRLCARPSCSQPAAATLEYNYAEGVVWLDGLAPDDHPMTHDLCVRHAGSLRVPRGWQLDDRRENPNVRRLRREFAAEPAHVQAV